MEPYNMDLYRRARKIRDIMDLMKDLDDIAQQQKLGRAIIDFKLMTEFYWDEGHNQISINTYRRNIGLRKLSDHYTQNI